MNGALLQRQLSHGEEAEPMAFEPSTAQFPVFSRPTPKKKVQGFMEPFKVVEIKL